MSTNTKNKKAAAKLILPAASITQISTLAGTVQSTLVSSTFHFSSTCYSPLRFGRILVLFFFQVCNPNFWTIKCLTTIRAFGQWKEKTNAHHSGHTNKAVDWGENLSFTSLVANSFVQKTDCVLNWLIHTFTVSGPSSTLHRRLVLTAPPSVSTLSYTDTLPQSTLRHLLNALSL